MTTLHPQASDKAPMSLDPHVRIISYASYKTKMTECLMSCDVKQRGGQGFHLFPRLGILRTAARSG